MTAPRTDLDFQGLLERLHELVGQRVGLMFDANDLPPEPLCGFSGVLARVVFADPARPAGSIALVIACHHVSPDDVTGDDLGYVVIDPARFQFAVPREHGVRVYCAGLPAIAIDWVADAVDGREGR